MPAKQYRVTRKKPIIVVPPPVSDDLWDDAEGLADAPIVFNEQPDVESVKTPQTAPSDPQEQVLPLQLPERWIVSVPEDNTLPPLMHFYDTRNEIILTLPLTKETVDNLYPVIDAMYEKPVKKEFSWAATKKWLWKHKFTSAILFILLGLIGFNIIYSAFV